MQELQAALKVAEELRDRSEAVILVKEHEIDELNHLVCTLQRGPKETSATAGAQSNMVHIFAFFA